MSRYRNVALAVGAWLLVVTGGAVLVWTVISQAGKDVAGAPPLVNASASPTGAPSARPSPTGQGPDGAVRGTWRGAAGLVVGECTGAAFTLVSATPSSGWKVDFDDSGDDVGRVEFETVDERTRVRVEGSCEGGAPSFSVDTRTKG
jgi:hypothetical protein